MSERTEDQLVIELREALAREARSVVVAEPEERVGAALARAQRRRRSRVSAVVGIAAALVVAMLVGIGYAAWRPRAEVAPAATPLGAACSTAPASTTGSRAPTSTVSMLGGAFSRTGSMTTARNQDTATLLCDGRVLIAGGNGVSGALSSAELYDPSTGTFSPTGSLITARMDHTATLLPNGMVLIAGGFVDVPSGNPAIASAELYDPATGKFKPTGSMTSPRFNAAATLLPNGKVLIAGGTSFDVANNTTVSLTSAELYDPATGKFSPTGSMSAGSPLATATLLLDGKVLVIGGAPYLYDPATGTFSPTGAMVIQRYGHTATLLSDGRVLIAGGMGGPNLVTPAPASAAAPTQAELYGPTTGTFSATGSMATDLYHHTATLLPDGRVLIAGGFGEISELGTTATAELYDSKTGKFSATGPMATARDWQTATALPDGRVLIAGGEGQGAALASAELYQP